MKAWWIIILAVGLVGAATFIPFVKTTEGMTTVTGTTLTTEAWLGLQPVTRKHASPLANWCEAHGLKVTEDTVFFSKITKNAWGKVWARGSSRPPACYDFKESLQKAWLARTPDQEVGRFIEAMMVIGEPERARLIEAAIARARAEK